MRSGICPRCGSAAVHNAQGAILRNQEAKITIRTGGLGWSSAESDDYVCTACGYFEQYFSPGKTLERIARTWRHVTPGDRPRPEAGPDQG
ncbi:hypothetical protein [Kitasatospora sp. NPDC002040]|uniref:hypothetical protein n=1 Tax=Kitasatospora sp. NPDC002040 TaxID=3154661 RepID=UPI003322C14B